MALLGGVLPHRCKALFKQFIGMRALFWRAGIAKKINSRKQFFRLCTLLKYTKGERFTGKRNTVSLLRIVQKHL